MRRCERPTTARTSARSRRTISAIHPRVTLNLGVRYDLQLPYTDPQDRKLAFVPGQKSRSTPTAPVGLLFPGDTGVSRGIVHTDVNNIAPRLGVAWDPKGDGRMAVRAAFGMFYGSITGNEWNTTADNQPFTVRQSFPTVFTLSDPYRNLPGGVGPFPFNYTPATPRFTLPAQVFGPSLDFVWPVSYQTNITVEKETRQELQRDRVVRRVVRAESRRRAWTTTIRCSAPTRDDGERQRAAAVSCPARSARPRVLSSIFGSDYNGLQMSAERRGSSCRARRTTRSAAATRTSTSRAAACRACRTRRGSAPNAAGTSDDRTHSLVLSGVWKIDYFDDSSSVVRVLARDWTVSAIATLQTGTPLTIGAGTDRNFDGLTNDRADLVGDPELDHGRPTR